jgi:phosphonate transport system substrate-binding protein
MKPGVTRVLTRIQPFDHCCFTAIDTAPVEQTARFAELLFDMKYDDPEVRPLMDLEGLKAWKPGRTNGFSLLSAAVDRFHTLDAWLDRIGS